MSIRTVEAAFRHGRSAITEWDEQGFGFGDWLEVHTRYAVIDPVITALGWDTADPKECHPEYPRYGDGEPRARVDYALFAEPDLLAIGNYEVAPNVIIEAKSVGVELGEHVEQLEGYAEAAHRMRNGVAVLTNGREWWLYDLDRRGSFHGKRLAPINILEEQLERRGSDLDRLA